MRKSAAKRFVDSLERELALHREMLDFAGGPGAHAAAGARPELGLSGSICLAARMRTALRSALADVEHGGTVFEAFESLPADEAARAAELRREFEAVLAALSPGGRVRGAVRRPD